MRWTPENPSQNVHYPRLTIANTNDNNYLNMAAWPQEMDLWMFSFMRLKQATFSHSFITPDGETQGHQQLTGIYHCHQHAHVLEV